MGTTFCILCSQFPLLPSFLLFWVTSQQQGPNFLANENHKVLSLALRGSSVVEDLPRRYEILDLTSSPTNTHSTCMYMCAYTHISSTQVYKSGKWLARPHSLCTSGNCGSITCWPHTLYASESLRELVNADSSPGKSACSGQVGIFISNWHPGHPTQKALEVLWEAYDFWWENYFRIFGLIDIWVTT